MTTEIEILQYLHYNPLSKRAEILPSLSKQVSDRTLMFYEQNNIAAFKRIFIEQFLFAVKTYF